MSMIYSIEKDIHNLEKKSSLLEEKIKKLEDIIDKQNIFIDLYLQQNTEFALLYKEKINNITT